MEADATAAASSLSSQTSSDSDDDDLKGGNNAGSAKVTVAGLHGPTVHEDDDDDDGEEACDSFLRRVRMTMMSASLPLGATLYLGSGLSLRRCGQRDGSYVATASPFAPSLDHNLISFLSLSDFSFHFYVRRLSFSSPSSSSSSPIHSSSNPLTKKVTRPEELSPKHNIFEEEVCFEDINQAIDNWEIPKIPQDELYVPDDNKRKSDYIIKTAENNIPLGPDSGEEFHLLTKQSVREHARHYRYLHIGCVQVAVKPLIREGLNASILMCLRDIRHNDFQDSLIGTVKTSLGHGPVYFNCFPNKTVSLLDLNILDSLFLNIRIHGLNMKEGSIPATLIYRIQYKVMNTCNSRVLLKSQDRETTLFVTDMTKANVMIPRLIKWDEIDLPQSWSIDRAIPTQPRQAPLLREVKQDESGKVEIFFDR
ncbi:polyprotein [Arachis hypogaea]|nr:polyprotein [Arachis hypogaea]